MCCAAPACSGPLSTLDAAGPGAAAIATLWWAMLAGAAVILALVMALVLLAFTPWRSRLALPPLAWLVGGGLVFPSVTIVLLLFFGLAAGESMLPHERTPAALRVEATARQWEWTFRYPQRDGLALEGRLYLPVGRAVDVHVTSEDVIHGFWIPRLAGKIDALPGHVNVIRIVASEPGAFAAQCAEFCGVGHTAMTFTAEALPEEEFEARLRSLAAAGVRP